MRQRPFPFGGAVGPTNTDPLVWAEEWESGVGAFPLLGPGFQQLPAQWTKWQPPTAPQVETWVDALAQAAGALVSTPGVDGEHQWGGALMPYPQAADGPDGFSWRSLYAYCHFPAFTRLPPELAELWTAIVIGLDDAQPLATYDSKFLSLGLVLQPDGTSVTAALAEWSDSRAIAAAQQRDMGGVQPTGALFRLDIVASVAQQQCQLLGRYSTDGGLGWFPIGFVAVPLLPRCIGFGTSGRFDSLIPVGNEGIGGNAFMRLYDRPATETTLLVNVDGGRNWP